MRTLIHCAGGTFRIGLVIGLRCGSNVMRGKFKWNDYNSPSGSSLHGTTLFAREKCDSSRPTRRRSRIATSEPFSELVKAIRDTKLKKIDKLNYIYGKIAHFRTKRSGKGGIVYLPNEIHNFLHQCYIDLPPDELKKHYQFLIKCDVKLSSTKTKSLWQSLLKGPAAVSRLASFQTFLDSNDLASFGKFNKLHDVKEMETIINYMIKNGQMEYIDNYLKSVVEKLEVLSLDPQIQKNDLHLSYLAFNNILLHFFSKTNNLQQFMEKYKGLLKYSINNKILLNKKYRKRIIRIPSVLLLSLLRAQGDQQKIINIFASLQEYLGKHKDVKLFKTMVMMELLRSFRTLQDPQLTCIYLLSTFGSCRTRFLLNDLGIWSWVFENSSRLLPRNEILNSIKDPPIPISSSLKENGIIPKSLLFELYSVLLYSKSKTMIKEDFRVFLSDLFVKYVDIIEKKRYRYLLYNQTTSILNLFLKHMRYQLHDTDLAFESLKRFYSLPRTVIKAIKNESQYSCPFSLVLYENYSLDRSQVSEIMGLMMKNKQFFSYKFYSAMILRNLKVGHYDEGKHWYDKMRASNFTARDFVLVDALSKADLLSKDENRLFTNIPDEYQENDSQEQLLDAESELDFGYDAFEVIYRRVAERL